MLRCDLGQTKFEIEKTKKMQTVAMERATKEQMDREVAEYFPESINEDSGAGFAERHAHNVDEDIPLRSSKKRLTKPPFARSSVKRDKRVAFEEQSQAAPVHETKAPLQGHQNQPSGIYQYMPFYPPPMQQQIPSPYLGYTCPHPLQFQSPLSQINQNVDPNILLHSHHYPNLQGFMTMPATFQPPHTFTNATSGQENHARPFSQAPKSQTQTLGKSVSKNEAQAFKHWTAETKNRASGLEFFFDRKATLYRNASISIGIKQNGCFKDESRPHARFVLTFNNLTEKPLTHFKAVLSTKSQAYVLMANAKKLESQLRPSVEQKMAFVVFPKAFTVEGLKLMVQFEGPSEVGALKRHELVTNVTIPVHKLLKFGSIDGVDYSPRNLGGIKSEKTTTYSNTLIRYPDEIMNLFAGIQKNKTETDGVPRVFYTGKIRSLVDPANEEMLFEAEVTERMQTVRFAVRSNEPATQQRTQFVNGLVDSIARELQML
jgi:hypothetical protein